MNGRTIVVVEDEPEVLLMVQSVLEDEGYDVVGVKRLKSCVVATETRTRFLGRRGQASRSSRCQGATL